MAQLKMDSNQPTSYDAKRALLFEQTRALKEGWWCNNDGTWDYYPGSLKQKYNGLIVAGLIWADL